MIHLRKILYNQCKTATLSFLAAMLLCVCNSCVFPHDNYVAFEVSNDSSDTLMIVTESLIPEFNVFTKNRIAGTSTSHTLPSDTIFYLPPNSSFKAETFQYDTRRLLSNDPEADGITPGWKFIKRMGLGGHPLPSETWNTRQKWIVSWEYEDEARMYLLTIN